jgi:hypothetical protein
MSRINLGSVVLVLLVCFSSSAFAQPLTGNAMDKSVLDAIKAGQDYLLNAQNKADGSWLPYSTPADKVNYHPGGPGALALYALLESAKSVPDHEISITDPQIKKGLDWLCSVKTDRTYSLALRASALQLAVDAGGDDYKKQLFADVQRLIDSANDSKNPSVRGSYYYPVYEKGKATGEAFDNSNSNYGLLGVWAGARANFEVPPEYWLKVMNHWLDNQNQDGGWSYGKNGNSTSTMTAGAVASLFVCIDNVLSDAFVKCDIKNEFKPAEDGLAWMDRDITAHGIGNGWQHYYLYNLERVGLATGRKYFGTSDWYKLGAEMLIRSQNAGAWNGNETAVPATAYSILFLVRGQHPVLFNKLQHTGDPLHPGDWDNRPRALANAMGKLNEDLENSVSWQIINMQVPVSEWHDAPILVITGSTDPKFTPADIDKLRAYVQQGGMIFSITECSGTGGMAFSKAMADVYKQLFPDYELTKLPDEHDLYHKDKTHYNLPPDQLRLFWVTNGVRPLALHTDVDLTLPLQLKSKSNKAFLLPTNLAVYVSTRISYLPHRGTSSWPLDEKAVTTSLLKVAKLKYTGNYDPEPLAWERFATFMANDQKFKVDVSAPMEIAKLTNDYPLAVITGTAKQTFTQEDKDALKKYVAQGGTLFIDAAGGAKDFADSAQTLVEDIWGKRKLKTLTPNCEIYAPPGKPALAISKFFYTATAKKRNAATKDPSLRGITDNGRITVIFSHDDITAGLIGALTKTIDGYTPETAYNIMRNIVTMVHENIGKAPAAGGPAATTAPAATTRP